MHAHNAVMTARSGTAIRLVAIIFALVAIASVLVAVSPSAHAVNRCGTSYAGKMLNDSGFAIKVKGDTSSGTYVTRTVYSGSSASAVGICDADFMYPPKAYWVYHYSAPYTYSAYAEYKIGSRTVDCHGYYSYRIGCDAY